MTADYRTQAIEDPTAVIQDLHHAHPNAEGFPHLVAEHFANIFPTQNALQKIPILNVQNPPESYRDRTLVRFRAMVQDTSLSTEMYLSKHNDGSCGGWGIYEPEEGSSSRDVNYANLRQCNVLWATTVPAESAWCLSELDGRTTAHVDRQTVPAVATTLRRSHKYPHADSEHIGIQVKIYDIDGSEGFKSTDVMTFVGILSTEPCGLDQMQESASEVPTLHVLFITPHTPNLLPRPFPRLVPQSSDSGPTHVPQTTIPPKAQDTPQIRDELISWIADEALGGDRQAAEWVLLSSIARVQSRHPPLFPPSIVISRFPPPPPVPSTSTSPASSVPTLSAILSLLLPLMHTLSLSLEGLNKSKFMPESKDEDLHAGVLQLPQGTVLLVSEGCVQEGQLLERGIMNVRALQEVMDAQTLAYVFPYSQFSFPTDISCVVLAEGSKSTFFKTELNVPLASAADPATVAALYKPADQVKLPSREKLEAFRDLVVGARCGKVQVPEATSEHIQAQFVCERQRDRSITADDLIRWMSIAKLYALSLHEPTLAIETWQRAKALDDKIQSLVA